VFVDRFGAEGALAGLEVVALGAHARVARGEIQEVVVSRFHDRERRVHAVRDLRAVQVACPERVAPQQVAVLGIDERAAAERHVSPRNVANHRRDRANGMR
jgi:hypothetical protein